jgi:hypothetical protein
MSKGFDTFVNLVIPPTMDHVWKVKRQVFNFSFVCFGWLVTDGVARFFLVHDTKTGKNVPKEHIMYRMVIKYPKYP